MIINSPQPKKHRAIFILYRMFPVLPLINRVAKLLRNYLSVKELTYKILNNPLPVHVLRNKKSLLMNLKSKKEQNMIIANILQTS